ncbi:hypothetical protein [Lutibacter sp. B1]|uniref:hypothetical protein n=1 Tax=Lutibacter sp. B1 TaxID=2725996 RepID=UPI0014571541|nr:hypothetical protein [Lutibacter sp. B1]NLP58969.1 hypothetical protein [Lutibacter sp. B1]
MKNHWIWIVIGCGLPLLFIFLAPSFGIRDGSTLFVFIFFMFVIHLFMPHKSHSQRGYKHGNHKTSHNHNKKESTEIPKEEHKDYQHHQKQ